MLGLRDARVLGGRLLWSAQQLRSGIKGYDVFRLGPNVVTMVEGHVPVALRCLQEYKRSAVSSPCRTKSLDFFFSEALIPGCAWIGALNWSRGWSLLDWEQS